MDFGYVIFLYLLKRMDAQLVDLLRGTGKVSNTNDYTHVSLYGPKAQWTIQHNKMSDFWVRYCQMISDNPAGNFALAERNQETMPLIVEIVLKFDADVQDDAYDDSFVVGLVYSFQTAMRERLQISENEYELICCCLESSEMWSDTAIGGQRAHRLTKLRLQFPYCRAFAQTLTRYIQPRAVQLLRSNNIIARLPHQPIGDWNQILKIPINEPVLMYGSEERAGRPKLNLGSIYGVISENDFLNSAEIFSIDLNTAFVPNHHSHAANGIVSKDTLDAYDLDTLLPMFLSIHYWGAGQITLPRDMDTPVFEVDHGNDDLPTNFGTGMNYNEKDDLDIAGDLISMINSERFLKRMYWLSIGKALSSADSGGPNGENMWIRVTENAINKIGKTPDYLIDGIQETCAKVYNELSVGNHTTIKTIAWFAKEDNPQRYKDWHNQWCMVYMEKAMSLTHADIAEALYRCFWLDYVCSSIREKAWYQFRKCRWVKIDQGVNIRLSISKDFLRKFEIIRTKFSRQIQESRDDAFKVTAEAKMKQLNNLISKLRNHTFKMSIMSEAMDIFYHETFEAIKDRNVSLTGLLNGVIEVDYDRASVEFRSGRPEDFLTKVTGVSFPIDYTWEHPKMKTFMKWIEQTFVDSDLRHLFLKLNASGLIGGNLDKILPIFTGDGNNGKSCIVRGMEIAWGSYVVKFPSTGMSRGFTDSNSPNPAWARLDCCRFAFADETDEEETLRSGPTKLITGGDSFYAAKKFENGSDIQPTGTVILSCNRVPSFNAADKALKERVRIIPYLSTWSFDAPESIEEQIKMRHFKRDNNFIKSVAHFGPAFIWAAFTYFPTYCKEGLSETEEVKKATLDYWNDTDPYILFANDVIEIAKTPEGKQDEKAKLNITEIYNRFKIWYKTFLPAGKVPERRTVRYHLVQSWGPVTDNGWSGIRFKDAGNDNAAGNAMAMTNALAGAVNFTLQ